ncbi:hypothetical protein BsWGS_03221 [Bradybaena similaris]
MAGDSLKSMYKVKMRDENTLSKRRVSRGLERKQHRQDEVNKRRLLSEDMSPVKEDGSIHDNSPRGHKPHKPVAHEKISTRLERLKQWREEKKRQTEQEKKGRKKPVFKVSPLKHVGESQLYKRTPARQVKPVWPAERAHRHHLSVAVSNSSRQPAASGQTGMHKSAFHSVVPAERKSTKSQAAAATSMQPAAVQPAIAKPQPRTRQHAAVQPAKSKSQPRTRQQAAVQPAVVESTKHQPRTRQHAAVSQSAARNDTSIATVQQTGNRADLATKLTVSSAAKAKANVSKPKAFLRANSRVTRTIAQSQTIDNKIHHESKKKEKQENLQPHEAVKADDHMDFVCASEPEHELHLSDSAVSTPKHSTPAPRRHVRGKRASADTNKHDVDGCKKRPGEARDSCSRDASAMDVQMRDQRLAAGQQASLQQEHALPLLQPLVSEHRSRSSAGTRHKKPRKVHMQDVGQYGCPEQGETSVEYTQTPTVNVVELSNTQTPAVYVLELSNKENVACPKSQLLPVSNATPYRKQSHRWNVADQHLSQQDYQVTAHVPASGKRKSRRLSRLSAAANEENSGTSSAPATAKRARSVTVAEPRVEVDENPSLVQKDSSNTQLPVDLTAASHSQETSGVPKRKSVRIATLVFSSPAVSHTEGEVVTTKYRKTPAAKRRKSTATNLPQVESPRATFVSVSDEGTSHLIGDNSIDWMAMATATPPLTRYPVLSGKSVFDGIAVSCQDPSTAYQVRKPVDAEASLRALQELPVHKCPGKTSFIEVPCDDSTDVAPRSVPPPALLITAATAGDNKFKGNSSVTPVTEEDNQSTQPFTPRSNEMSTSVASSQRSSDENVVVAVTPRSSRSRGLSMSGFKTPGQPTPAARSQKRSRRRQTQMNTQLKSPEEMIEILKKSPMVELTRRQSRRVQPSVSGVDPLSASVGSLDVYIRKTEDAHLVSAADLLVAQDEEVSASRQLDASSGVQHFRELLLSERARLQQLCDAWAQISTSTPNLDEDVLGQIRSTIGKAQLLMDQRFQQFSGLVDNCQFGLGEKETTVTDLQGFWEMIYFQVQDVNLLFTNLTELQHNQWHVKQTSPAKEVCKRRAVKIRKPKVKSNFAAFREEVIKRRAQAVSKPAAEGTSDTSKVFDAGFFQVTSPVRCLAGRQSQTNSPLMTAAVETSSSSEDKLSQDGHVSPESSKQQSQSPENTGNKENLLSTNASSCSLPPLSAKRLSYLPAVPSPLLNDITGLLSKKS